MAAVHYPVFVRCAGGSHDGHPLIARPPLIDGSSALVPAHDCYGDATEAAQAGGDALAWESYTLRRARGGWEFRFDGPLAGAP